MPAGGVNGAVEATGNVAAGSPPATPHTLDLSRLRRAVDSFAKAARNMAAAIELVNIGECTAVYHLVNLHTCALTTPLGTHR